MAVLPRELSEFHKVVVGEFGSHPGVGKPLHDFLSEIRGHEGGKSRLKFRGWFNRPKNLATVHFQFAPGAKELRITAESEHAYQRMVLVVRPGRVERQDETYRATYRDSDVKANLALSNKIDRLQEAFKRAMGIKDAGFHTGREGSLFK